jgi:hypothetical protein
VLPDAAKLASCLRGSSVSLDSGRSQGEQCPSSLQQSAFSPPAPASGEAHAQSKELREEIHFERRRYDNGGGAAAPVAALTGAGGGGGGGRGDRRCTLALIKDEALGSGGNSAYVQARALLDLFVRNSLAGAEPFTTNHCGTLGRNSLLHALWHLLSTCWPSFG